MQEKVMNLSLGEKLIAGSGILLFLDALILPWYKVSFSLGELGGGSVSRSGVESPGAIWSLLAALIGLVLAGSIAAKLGNVALPALPSGVTWGMAYFGGGAVAFVLLVIKYVNESSYVSYGFWLGFLLTIAMAAGGYLLYTEEKAKG